MRSEATVEALGSHRTPRRIALHFFLANARAGLQRRVHDRERSGRGTAHQRGVATYGQTERAGLHADADYNGHDSPAWTGSVEPTETW